MKEIPLHRKNKSTLYAIVDNEDYEKLSSYTWNLNSYGYAYRLQELESYATAKASGKTHPKRHSVLMHRQVKNLQRNDGLIIDHIDGNRLNNQKNNLRIVTHKENHSNKGKPSGKRTSIYRNVVKTPANTWRVYPKAYGVRVNIGHFKNEEAAFIAAELWCQKHRPLQRPQKWIGTTAQVRAAEALAAETN